MADVGRAAFDCVERLKHCVSLEQIRDELSKAGAALGYDCVTMFELPKPCERLDQRLLLSTWPLGWAERYRHENYARFDPVMRRARCARMPFAWSQARCEPDDRFGQRVMLEAKHDFGLAVGLTVPVMAGQDTRAIVSFGARHADAQSENAAALHLVAIYAHSALMAMRHHRCLDRQRAFAIKLSPREVECLKWTASGKTAWEISVILSLAERTVREYIDSAARKLGAANRPQAVAEAIRQEIFF